MRTLIDLDQSLHQGSPHSNALCDMKMNCIYSRPRGTNNFSAAFLGPKLYKEPSSKSNKPIIHNAIAHCCLAGKVNEALKNQTLDVSEINVFFLSCYLEQFKA